MLAATAAASRGESAGAAPLVERGRAQASLFISPTGNDGGACTQAAPCASFDRAYKVAKPGQVIEVAGGAYGPQRIGSRASARNLTPGCAPGATQSCIAFQPAAGQVVTINGSLEIRGSSVWIHGSASPPGGIPSRSRSYTIKVTGYVDTEADSESVYPDHVLVEGVDATSFGIFNVKTATFRNLDVGPATSGVNCRIVEGPGFENKIGGAGGNITVVPTDITIDRVLIHNQNRDAEGAASDCHFGGLFLAFADGLTIKNSVFSQNAVYNIQVQNFGGAPPPRNVTIENSVFGCPVEWLYDSAKGGENACNRQADLQFNAASAFDGWLIRHNSFVAGLGQYVEGASYSNFRVVGNAGSRPSRCYPGMTFAYNAWDGTTCSATDRNVQHLPFVSTTPGQEDPHLARGSGATALVQPSSPDLSEPVDIEGRIRPLRFPRDAGAVQRDTAVLVLGRTIGMASIGMSRDAVLRLYGNPRSSKAAKLGIAKTSGQIDIFSVPGGTLRVTSVDGKVVGLATASPYYTTPKGLGAGSPLDDTKSVSHIAWEPCKKAFRRAAGPVTISFRAGAGRKKVAEVIMIRRPFEQPCAAKKPAKKR